MNIFVGNIAKEVSDNELQELFSQYGIVNTVKIIRDMFSQESKGFGFVEMRSQADAKKAMDELNTFDLKGKKLVVNEARPQNNIRRGGKRSGGRGNNQRGGGRRGW